MNKAQELLKISKDVNNSIDISRALAFIYDKCTLAANRGDTTTIVKINEFNQYFERYGNVHARVMSELRDQGFVATVMHPSWGESYIRISWLKS